MLPTPIKHETHEAALPEIQKHIDRLGKLQYELYADANQSLLVVVQALDAAGKNSVLPGCSTCSRYRLTLQ
jgi:polyphosphate kinase 2 (PPK2 family)